METLEELYKEAFKSIDTVCEGLVVEKPEHINLVEAKLLEGTWALASTMKDVNKLKHLMQKPLTPSRALKELYGLLGDDNLFDELDAAEEAGEKDCRPIIQEFIRENVIHHWDDWGAVQDDKVEDGVHDVFLELSEMSLKEEVKADATKQSLTEETFNLSSEDGIEKMKDFIEKDEEAPIEQKIVDPTVTDEKDLKKNYLGDMILQCTTCHQMIFKPMEEIVKVEDSGEGAEARYNEDEVCTHCGAHGPFILVGQVGAASAGNDEQPEHDTRVEPKAEPVEKEPEEPKVEEKTESAKEEPKANTVEEPKKSEDNKKEKEEQEKNISVSSVKDPKERHKVEPKKESFSLKENIDNIDEAAFDSLANKFAHSIYENIESYTTTAGEISDEDKLILEGIIKFNSGKTLNTKFIFESKGIHKGKIKLVGVNETFTTSKKPFVVLSESKDKNLVCESFSYNYLAKADKIAKGTVTNK